MNIGMNYTNNVNFNGKLEIKDVHIDKKRWENIAKIYEDITTKGQGAIGCDMGLFSEGRNKAIFIQQPDYLEDDVVINKEAYAKLMKLSDDKIARKFAKLYKLINRGVDIADAITRKVLALAEGALRLRGKDLEYDIYSAVAEAQNNRSLEIIQKDKILRDFDIKFSF